MTTKTELVIDFIQDRTNRSNELEKIYYAHIMEHSGIDTLGELIHILYSDEFKSAVRGSFFDTYGLFTNAAGVEYVSPRAKECIYIISSSDGSSKIGRSIDPLSRIAGLSTATHHKLNLVMSVPVSDAGQIEKELHQTWAHKHLAREWFNLSEADIQEITDYVTRNYWWE